MNPNARIFWIVWCIAWAGFWAFIGGPLTLFLGWFMVPVSLAAILIPIGCGPNGSTPRLRGSE